MNAVRFSLILPMLGLAACAQMGAQTSQSRPAAAAATTSASPPEVKPASAEEIQAAAAITRAPKPRPAARATAAQLNTTTQAQRNAAAKPAEKAETRLGTTVATLGDATEPGFWIKTPLVKVRTVGRIVNPANGKSAKVDLIPLDMPPSAGSQVSLPALQLIGISLTDLAEIEVYAS